MKLNFTGQGKMVDWDEFINNKEKHESNKNLSALQNFTRE